MMGKDEVRTIRSIFGHIHRICLMAKTVAFVTTALKNLLDVVHYTYFSILVYCDKILNALSDLTMNCNFFKRNYTRRVDVWNFSKTIYQTRGSVTTNGSLLENTGTGVYSHE